MTFKGLVGVIGIDQKKLREYKWFFKKKIRKYSNRHGNPLNMDSSIPIVFRLDDVGFNFVKALIEIIELFLIKNHNLSLGLVMNQIGGQSILIEKIIQGKNRGLLELALHGWNHIDYSKLSEKEQHDSLGKASERMQSLFGASPKTFIPPYNSFNAATLRAMNTTGIRIISSVLNYEVERHIFSRVPGTSNITDPDGTYHIPEMASFERWDNYGHPMKIPIKQILDDIRVNIRHYGYAVVTLHPVTFTKIKDGKFTDEVDEHQIGDLTTLIESIELNNMFLTTFSKMTGIK